MKVFRCKSVPNGWNITILGKRFHVNNAYRAKTIQRYNSHIKKLREIYGKRKIRVAFLVNEQAKWQFDSLYHELEASTDFEPVILVSQCSSEHDKIKYFEHRANMDKCLDFFVQKGLRVRAIYDTKKQKYVSPKKWEVDIVFYSQPWELDDSQHPIAVSKWALTCYVTYGLLLADEDRFVHHPGFHDAIWRIYCEDREQPERVRQIFGEKAPNNRIFTGYPKLDDYRKITPIPHRSKKVVIYAPHHSVEKDALSLKLATFLENGREILQLAQSCNDTVHWVFKPHPRLQYALVRNNIMTPKEVEDYYQAWTEVGEVYEGGSYMEMFINSDAMLTDCCSFLGEYLPSGHPILHLISPDAKFNAFAESFIGTFYQIRNMEELKIEFERVIMNGDDYKKEERIAKTNILIDPEETATSKIMTDIRNTLKKG